MNQYHPCPKCGATNSEKMTFTWWGGLLGPKLLTHVKCPGCGTQYNGKSGKDNTMGIVIYSIAMLIIFGTIFLVLIALAIAVSTS